MALRPRTTIFLAVLAVAAVGGAAAAVTYPRLSDRRDAVHERWDALRTELSERYDHAERLGATVGSARPDLALAADLGEAVDVWSRSGSSPDDGSRAANRVEGLAARVVRIVAASASLRSDARVADAVEAFVRTAPGEALERYTSAVERYDGARNRFPGPWLASLLGFDAVGVVDIPTGLEDVELPVPTSTTAAPSTTTTSPAESG